MSRHHQLRRFARIHCPILKKQLCHYTRLLLINLYYDYITNSTKKQDAKCILREKLSKISICPMLINNEYNPQTH